MTWASAGPPPLSKKMHPVDFASNFPVCSLLSFAGVKVGGSPRQSREVRTALLHSSLNSCTQRNLFPTVCRCQSCVIVSVLSSWPHTVHQLRDWSSRSSSASLSSAPLLVENNTWLRSCNFNLPCVFWILQNWPFKPWYWLCLNREHTLLFR